MLLNSSISRRDSAYEVLEYDKSRWPILSGWILDLCHVGQTLSFGQRLAPLSLSLVERMANSADY